MILRAREHCEGARHGFDCDNSVLEGPLARLASGSSWDEGDKGRLTPDDAGVFSTRIKPSESIEGPFRMRQESETLSRPTIIRPCDPAQRRNVGFLETQAAQTKLSYSSPDISGGGRPEDEASEAASSTS